MAFKPTIENFICTCREQLWNSKAWKARATSSNKKKYRCICLSHSTNPQDFFDKSSRIFYVSLRIFDNLLYICFVFSPALLLHEAVDEQTGDRAQGVHTPLPGTESEKKN